MSFGYNVNCKFIITDHECSNEEVKKEAWGWGKHTLCKDWVAGPGQHICRFREEVPKPKNFPPPPPQGKTN